MARVRKTRNDGGSEAVAAADGGDALVGFAVVHHSEEGPRGAAEGDERRGLDGASMIKEFKEFAVSGNVMDLAVGIVIGAAFKGIVDSFVADILTPLLGLITGGIDFS